jgi:hypothetical protein
MKIRKYKRNFLRHYLIGSVYAYLNKKFILKKKNIKNKYDFYKLLMVNASILKNNIKKI